MGLGKTPNRELLPFFRKLGPEFDSYARRGTMLIHTPVTRLLAGFHFDPTAESRDKRWLCYFVFPLYIPAEYVTLSWGWRIPWAIPTNPGSALSVFVHGSHEQVNETIRVMIDDGLSHLNPMMTPQGFYEALISGLYDKSAGTYFLHEARAFTAVLLGEKNAALDHIREGVMTLTMLDASSERRPDGLKDFEQDLLGRFKLIRDRLQEGGISAATAQLDAWQQHTAKALGIGDLMKAPA